MSLSAVEVPEQNVAIPPIASMPTIFRIESIVGKPKAAGNGMEYQSVIFHEKASLNVSFSLNYPEIRFKPDLLVSIRWKYPVNCVNGNIQIARLVILEHVEKGFNPFHTVPHGWVKDRALVQQAGKLFDAVPDSLQQLLLAVFWDGHRFRRFCQRPASLKNHHAFTNGLLVHTTQVSQIVLDLAKQYPQANPGLVLAAAFLHDAGKSEEYVPWANGWGMTDRGKLIGHRHTVIEWVSVALSLNRIALPKEYHLSLMHALTCAPNSEWLGIRAPATPEATLLSMADKLSGEADVVGSLANKNGGWGGDHPHRKAKPFTVPADVMNSAPLKSREQLLAEF